MPPSRNAPCPCGSSRKYKHCCMKQDRHEAGIHTVSPDMRVAAATEAWEADLLPFPGVRGDRPGAATVLSLVTAGGFVLHSDAFDDPGSEAPDVAAALAERVRAAARAVGGVPARLRVGDQKVAEALGPLLRPEGVGEVDSGTLPQIADAGRSLFSHLHEGEAWPPGGVRETWRAWGRTAPEIADLFRAAAAFHRAAPWTILPGEQPIAARMPGGRQWLASVMGSGGQEFGLSLHSHAEDFLVTLAYDPPDVWERLVGRVFGIVFGKRSDLPRAMQKEIAAAGWEVATPSAYPMLLSLRTPGGGICAADWADLVVLLDTIPRFVARGLRLATRDTAVVDRDAGITFWLLPAVGDGELPSLTPGGPEGPGAAPEAALLAGEGEVIETDPALFGDFDDWLMDAGLADTTIRKHVENAADLVAYLHDWEWVPLASVHEYDLRTFLFDWIHRKSGAPRSRVEAVPASLRKFFHFLAQTRGIRLPWAANVLAERDLYRERARTCPREPFWTAATREWLDPLTLDLHQRVMLPDDDLGEDDEWGDTMGDTEWTLHAELRRRWLLWRDELLRAGVTDHDELRAELERRQRAWEAAPNPRAGGRSPIEAVRAERETFVTSPPP